MLNRPVLVLDVRDVWVRMPFLALGGLTSTTCLQPRVGASGWPLDVTGLRTPEVDGQGVQAPNLTPRAFGRISDGLAPLNARVLARCCPDAGTVVFTRPDQRSLVRHFEGAHRIYYAGDDFSYEYGWPAELVYRWEQLLLTRTDRVICVSAALAKVFAERHGWPLERTMVSPNGFPVHRIPASCPAANESLPEELALERPVAGVLGSLSRRSRLDWVRRLVDSLPWLSWLFVGPAQALPDGASSDLEWLRRHPRCRFVGATPYAEFLAYSAMIDVAVIPYSAGGQNRVGTSARLFGHLPFGQPVLASRGCEQMEEFEPLVRVFDTVESMAAALEALRETGFDDGRREARWSAARENTWEQRAKSILALLESLD